LNRLRLARPVFHLLRYRASLQTQKSPAEPGSFQIPSSRSD
jgi:hypothetical protein